MRCEQTQKFMDRKKGFQWTAVLLAVCLMLTAFCIPAPAYAATTTATGVQKNVTVKLTAAQSAYKTSVRLGNKIKLNVMLGPAKLKAKKCKYKSLNKKIATVTKKGIIKPKKKGTTVITVTYKTRMTMITVKVKKAKKTTTTAASSSSASKTTSSSSKTTTSSTKKTSTTSSAKTTSSTSTKTSTGTTASGAAATLKGAPGRRTLKGYLQNALVPCGRTLYIYGGGWGEYGTKIGYQKTWKDFYEAKAGPSYDYSYYQFQREKGLDCSGFVAWVLYNTLHTRDNVNAGYADFANNVAGNYAAKGWATLTKNSADSVFKPGDVVSRSGHVWISLGQCSDGSVVILHSTNSSGVQIGGTKGKAVELARHYMKTYFPKWPYTAMQMGSSYWNYVGRARWKVSGTGHLLSDPDGIQKMSAEQVLRLLLGK